MAWVHPFRDCTRQLGSATERNGTAWINGEVRRTIVALVAGPPVFNPLLQIASAVDLLRWKSLKRGFQFAPEVLVHAEHPARGDAVRE